MELTVVKVGGSLFNLPDLQQRLEWLLAECSSPCTLMFPGGGPTADLVRGWQTRWGLNDDAAHDLAIHSLSLNARLLNQLVSSSVVVKSLAEAEAAWAQGKRTILNPGPLLEILEQGFADLAPPHTWDVTSDSLAAWTAERLRAKRLILAKSVELCPGTRFLDAMRQGMIDPYFPGIAGLLPQVDWCCLRADQPVLQPWFS